MLPQLLHGVSWLRERTTLVAMANLEKQMNQPKANSKDCMRYDSEQSSRLLSHLHDNGGRSNQQYLDEAAWLCWAKEYSALANPPEMQGQTIIMMRWRMSYVFFFLSSHVCRPQRCTVQEG